jgi:hypothetical protein
VRAMDFDFLLKVLRLLFVSWLIVGMECVISNL